MKFYKYSLIAALALSGALSACSDDIDYTPGAPVSGDEVFFPLTQSEAVDIPFDATSVDIDVNRLVADNAITVPVAAVVTDSEGEDATDIFTVPSQVSFAAGEKSTELAIGVDFSKVVAEEGYLITLTLEGDNTTPYGASTRTYTLAFSPWSEWKDVKGQTGVYTDSWFEEGEYDVLVKTCHSTIDDTRFKYAVCDVDWFYKNGDKRKEKDDDPPILDIVYTFDTSKTIEVDGVKCPIVSMNTVVTNYTNANYGGTYMCTDMRTYLIEYCGASEAGADNWMAKNSYGQSYYNPVSGTFFIDVAWTMTSFAEAGQLAFFNVAYDYLQLPGYKSYVLNFDYTGNFVDPYTEIEYAIVNAYKSEDVTSYVYDIFAGELDGDDLSAAIESVKNNDDLKAETAGTTNLAFALSEDGAYTVVGVGLDENDEPVCNQAYSFNFKSVRGGAVEKWNSLGFCEYTDGIVNNVFRVPPHTFDVEIQESDETPGLYRLVDPYKEFAEMYSESGATYLRGLHYIYIDAQNPEQVSIPYSEFGLDWGYGEMAVQSLSALALEYGYPTNVIAEKGWFGSLEDELITFPAGTLIGYDDDGEFDANRDPNNPTIPKTEEDIPNYDPYWGTGTFCVDMSGLTSSSNVKAKARTVGKFDISTPVKYSTTTKEFKSRFKIRKTNKPLKTVDAKTLKEYRIANPIRIN